MGALRPAQADGGRRRRPRGGRRLHPRPHRRPPRPAPRRRADRPQRGEGRACRCRGASPCCCARPFRPTRSPRSRCSGRNFADDEALRVGLADELADADGLRGPLPRCASRSSWRRTPTPWPPPRPRCAQDVLERMKAHERERMGELARRLVLGADPRPHARARRRPHQAAVEPFEPKQLRPARGPSAAFGFPLGNLSVRLGTPQDLRL